MVKILGRPQNVLSSPQLWDVAEELHGPTWTQYLGSEGSGGALCWDERGLLLDGGQPDSGSRICLEFPPDCLSFLK